MGQCEFLEKCPFYNDRMVKENQLGTILKAKYCRGNKLLCARYKIATSLGKEYLNNMIFPYMNDRAEQLIAEVKNTTDKN